MAKEIATDHNEIATNQNAKFRSGYAKLVTMLVGLVLVMFVLTAMFLLVNLMPTAPRYYATSTNGQLYPMSSLSEPVVTDAYLTQWISTIAGGIYTVSFNNWQNQLNKYQDDFTPLAWQDLQGAYNNGFADSLVQNQWLASAVVTQTPKILDRSIINGRYTWSVIVPVLINFTNAGASSKQAITLSLTVSRVPVLSDPGGIQITHLHSQIQSQGAANG